MVRNPPPTGTGTRSRRQGCVLKDPKYVRSKTRDDSETHQKERLSLQVPPVSQRRSILGSPGTTFTRWGTDKVSGKGILCEPRSFSGVRVVGKRPKNRRRGKSDHRQRKETGDIYKRKTS